MYLRCPTCGSEGPCYFTDSGNAMPYRHGAMNDLLDLVDRAAQLVVEMNEIDGWATAPFHKAAHDLDITLGLDVLIRANSLVPCGNPTPGGVTSESDCGTIETAPAGVCAPSGGLTESPSRMTERTNG